MMIMREGEQQGPFGKLATELRTSVHGDGR